MKYNTAQFTRAYGTAEQLPPSELPEIAFAGRSNVGKSSLLNRLFGRKALARVSSVPGKTITINFYEADGVNFVDLPGYGYAKVAKTEKQRWAKMMESYFNSGRDIRLVVQLVDMRHPPTADDLMMMDFLSQTGLDFVVVMTKRDKLKKKSEYNDRLNSSKEEMSFVPPERLIPFSAETGEGLDTVKKFIEQYIGG